MAWTHPYNLLAKFVSLLLPIFILIGIPYFEDSGIAICIISLITGILLYVYLFRTLGNYLYCRFTLKMKISLAQTKTLNDAFAPIPFAIGSKWLPLDILSDMRIDGEEKYAIALEQMKAWKAVTKKERIQATKDFKNSSVRNKATAYVLGGFLILSLISSFFNFPPASFFIKFYCDVFEEDHYPVMLMGMLPFVVLVLVYYGYILLVQSIRNKR